MLGNLDVSCSRAREAASADSVDVSGETGILLRRMMSNSKVDIRWDIENVTSLTPGAVESAVVEDSRGFLWKTSIIPNVAENRFIDFLLICENDWRGWKCEANVELVIHRKTDGHFTRKMLVTFDENMRACSFNKITLWNSIREPGNLCNFNNKFIVEFKIEILKWTIGDIPVAPPIDLTKFCSPYEAINVNLIIGGKKLRVSKDFLGFHSPVFAALFFGDFVEKEKEEVEIKDVVYEEFIDLLLLIFPVPDKINDSKLVHVLALADRFHMKQVLVESEEYLIGSRRFSKAQKL
ncbi:hypothetical protein PMAYCL1PPCAC_08376, partial [Pristionchus mayeri]